MRGRSTWGSRLSSHFLGHPGTSWAESSGFASLACQRRSRLETGRSSCGRNPTRVHLTGAVKKHGCRDVVDFGGWGESGDPVLRAGPGEGSWIAASEHRSEHSAGGLFVAVVHRPPGFEDHGRSLLVPFAVGERLPLGCRRSAALAVCRGGARMRRFWRVASPRRCLLTERGIATGSPSREPFRTRTQTAEYPRDRHPPQSGD